MLVKGITQICWLTYILKVLLKVTSILDTVTTYFHPNCMESEWYTGSFAITIDWSVSYRAETVRKVSASTVLCWPSQAGPSGDWRAVWAHSHPRLNLIWAQLSTCGAAAFPAHNREKQLRGQAPESDSLVSEKHSCTIYFLAMVQWGKSMNLLKCQILYLKMGTIHIKLKWSLNEVSTWW